MEDYYMGIAVFLMILCLIPFALTYIVLDRKIRKEMERDPSLMDKIKKDGIGIDSLLSFYKKPKDYADLPETYKGMLKLSICVKTILFLMMFGFIYCLAFQSRAIISILKKLGI